MSVGGAWLKELSRPPFDLVSGSGAGALRAALAFTLGSGVGALVAGSTAQTASWGRVLPSVIHLTLMTPFLLLVLCKLWCRSWVR
jgi:hypothetical protein